MMTAEMIQRAKEIAEDLFYDYEVIGIRFQEEPFELGKIRHLSHVWVDGEDTGDELDGICAQDIRTVEKVNNGYIGSHIAIIAGNEYTHGVDVGELIIEDAVVVEILA